MPQRATADLWNYAGAVFASIGYAAGLILLVERGAVARLRRALAAVGQMAFTNYLLQSVITSVVFLGWGFGLAGRFDYAQQLIVVAAIWAFQLVVSQAWLGSYRFGPAEWLWRSLTYWQLQPMRRDARNRLAAWRARRRRLISALVRKAVRRNNDRDVVAPTTIERELNELRARIVRARRPGQRLRDRLIVHEITQSIAAQ